MVHVIIGSFSFYSNIVATIKLHSRAAINNYLLFISLLSFILSQKIALGNYSETTVTHSHGFCCPASSPNTKDSSFTIINDQEYQQLFTFKKLQPSNVLLLLLAINRLSS